MNKVVIIGHFGGPKKFNDGQTIKSLALYNALTKSIGDVSKVDTYYIKHNPIKFVFQFLSMVLRNKKIIVLVSINGRKFLFPILYVLSKYLKKEVYHSGIGGRLAREVSEDKNLKKYVTYFKANWMESKLLVENLKKQGVENAVYVPNFKRLTKLTPDEIEYNVAKPFAFCIFSRVMKEKGVEDAIKAVEELNAKYDSQVAVLDIFGPIEEGYDEQLMKLLDKSPNCKYRGVVEANKSVEILKHYFCLLFPTHWRHEGIPGTIIDALASGTPIISRKWQYCTEMIVDHITGFIYEYDYPEELINIIDYAISHPEVLNGMKKNCLEKSEEYREENVIRQIIQLMDLNDSLEDK